MAWRQWSLPALAHCFEPGSDMIVHQIGVASEEGSEHIPKIGATDHPLEIPAATVIVGSVELRARELLMHPAQSLLVPGVHLEGDLRP